MRKLINPLLLAVALIFAVDLLYFLANSDRYVFGTEVGGWRYESARNYMLADSAIILAALISLCVNLVLPRTSRKDEWRR